MQEELNQQIGKLQQQIQAMQTAWPFLFPLLEEHRSEQIEALIASESPEARGRIKAITRIIELPQELSSTLAALVQAKADLPE